MLAERRREREKDAEYVAARFLEVASEDDLTSFSETVPQADVDAVLVVLADLLDGLDPRLIRGATPTDPPTWATVAMGDVQLHVPSFVSVRFAAGTACDVPLFLRTWPQGGGTSQYLHVFARRDDEAVAEPFLADLVRAARTERSPYRGRVVEAGMLYGGVGLRVVPTPDESRETLVFDDAVWDGMTRNVDRMFARMDRLRRAGLGANRGVLLAGPPGTGKTALCRALAREYEGRATVVIVPAAVGSYGLAPLYERLDALAPALVMLEDLDLLVGDRQQAVTGALVQFLTVLDGLMTRHAGIITIATTNDPDAIDFAARRAARFDQVIAIDLPDLPARRAILGLYLDRIEHTADVGALAQDTAGFTGADLREVVRAAVLDSITDVVELEDLARAVQRRRHALPASGPGPDLSTEP